MRIIESPARMQQAALSLRAGGRRIGLVPTMGCLHDGHRSLIRIARPRADELIVSLFVNPAQFGPGEDLAAYPRDFERDRALCEREHVDVLFCPAAADLYAPDHSAFVVEERLASGLCGAARPGHFRGVCTVVAKLFNLTLPHFAVFGEKDGQQLRVVERLVRDLNLPVEIVRGPTVREPDGLAMSSRNAGLSPEERRQAPALYQALQEARRLYDAGERRAPRLRERLRAVLSARPLIRVEYMEIVDDRTLDPVELVERPALVAVAAFAGNTRLIDNILLA